MALPSDLHPTRTERVQRHQATAGRRHSLAAAPDEVMGGRRGENRSTSSRGLGDRAAHINNLYLETKAHMLQIINDGLQIKLELCALNQQFADVLRTVDTNTNQYQQQQSLLPRQLTSSDQSDVSLQRPAPAIRLGSRGVRALYDMRRARLLARRNNAGHSKPVTSSRSGQRRQAADALTSTPRARDNRLTSSLADTSSLLGCDETERLIDVADVTLQDISAISAGGGACVLREQLSVNSQDWQSTSPAECRPPGMLHSTFSYPLHSTRSRLVSTAHLPPPPASFASDDDAAAFTLQETASGDTPRRRSQRLTRHQHQQQQQPVLCKEHGLHPTFGGPCIFVSSDDDAVILLDTTLSLSSSDGGANADFDNANPVTSPSAAGVGDRDHGDEEEEEEEAEADSRCDDVTCSVDGDDVGKDDDEMRTLRRQTGQARLSSPVRLPIGLSAAELLGSRPPRGGEEHNTSTEAVCSSMTNTSSSPESIAAAVADVTQIMVAAAGDGNEATLLASPAGVAEDKTLLSTLSSQLSVATLHNYSPESTTTTTTSGSGVAGRNLQVPVNSPNATDSGGSSSQHNAEDPYDYVEVPVPKVARVMHHPPAPPPVRRRWQQRAVHSAPSAAGSGRAHSPVDSAASHWSAQLPLHDGDSGFSTHSGSWRRSAVDRRYNERVVIGCELPRNQPVLANPVGPAFQRPPPQPMGNKLSRERQKTIVRKLKKFTHNFYRVNSSGELKIRTLGHF